MNKKYTLPVSEQFHSLQGEGPTTGVPSFFLRLKTCNLLCGGKGTNIDGQLHNGATWRCDTVEVWTKGVEKSFDQVIEDFGPGFVHRIKGGLHHLVLTGGEPLLHCARLNDFLAYVFGTDNNPGVYVEVETNGTLKPSRELSAKVTQFNVSPKLANSGMPEKNRIVPEVMHYFAKDKRSRFKFVVGSYTDMMEAIKTYIVPFNIPEEQVWFMPAADNEADLQRVSQDIAAHCIDGGHQFTTRMHVAIWNKKTGV